MTRLANITIADLDGIRQHALDALRLLEQYDQHHDDCVCDFCCACGEIGAAVFELRLLRQREERAA